MPLQRQPVTRGGRPAPRARLDRQILRHTPHTVVRKEQSPHGIAVFPLEELENRLVLAAPVPPALLVPPVPLLNPATVPQFVNTLPNPLDSTYVYQPTDAVKDPTHYDLGMYQATANILGTGFPTTPVFAYGTSPGTAVFPGKTFVVQKGQPISVTWTNGLPSTHLLEIDPTLLDASNTRMVYDPATNSIANGIPAVPHLHGGHSDAAYDGTPLQYWNAKTTGADYQTNNFVYANDQDAATLWYHDHAMGVTRLNAYAGMAGFYLIRDAFDTGAVGNPLGLPAGANEVPIVIQDKQFLTDGSLWYPAEQSAANPNVASIAAEMFGDTIVVNGKAWPNMPVQAQRYRLRLLNGSDSRFYTMSIAGVSGTANRATGTTVPIWQIGTDDGLMNAPVQLSQLTLGPGERADVIVDFTGFAPGTKFMVTNSAKTPFPGGTRVVAGLTDRIMMFTVGNPDGTVDGSTAPAALTNLRGADPVAPIAPTTAGTRQVALYETVDALGRILPLLGTPASSQTFMDPISEQITKGATEVWEIYNNTADAHPIHLHQVKFQVVSRQRFNAKIVANATTGGVAMGAVTLQGSPAAATGNELSYKDTIQIMPGEVIKVRATFDLEGKYVWHCHILSHEEHDMMRFFQVGTNPFGVTRFTYKPGTGIVANTPVVAAPLLSTFGADRIGVGDVISTTPEDTLAGDAAADVLA